MSGLRSQQRRWIRGGAQNARLHFAGILRSPLPRRVRSHAVQHLVAGSTYTVILAMLVLSVPLAAVRTPKSGGTAWAHASYSGRRVDPQILAELVMIVWLAIGLAVAAVREEPALVPLQLAGLAGTCWVVGLSVWHPLRARAGGTPSKEISATLPTPSASEEVAS